MNTQRVNHKIVSAINNNLPDGIKIIPYLMKTLHLSEKSAYRRISGESPFTFQETATIFADLNLSLDRIINLNKNQQAYFDIDATAFSNPETAYVSTLKQYIDILKRVYNAEHKEVTWNMNTILPIACMNDDILFKFFLYKYKRRMEKAPLDLSFSEFMVPGEILNLCKEGRLYYDYMLKYSTYISDDYMFFNTVKDILSYWEISLISKTELAQLKVALNNMLNGLTKTITDNLKEEHNKFIFYYSTLYIKTNCIHYNYDGNQICQMWMSPVNPIVIENPDICSMFQHLLKSSKKYSTLVTHSNEINQSSFLQKQHEYINLIP
jgi:hypothetical protein